MSDIHIRKVGQTGRITLNRPQALNALTLPMIRAMKDVLPVWAQDDTVKMVVIDAEGDKAFCAGGDIADIYRGLTEGDYDAARQFWREEYPLNAMLARYPKPIATFLQGFTMGGGVGVGCHASHRIVGETSRIAMPECGIGLVPDVGGTLLLAQAPGHLGEFMGTTAYRMGPGDAILAGFADHFLPHAVWNDTVAQLETTGDPALISKAATPVPAPRFERDRDRIDQHFSGETFGDILTSLASDSSDWAQTARSRITSNAPLAMAAAIDLIRQARASGGIEAALKQEYRFAHRVAEQGDFREGIRAAIIDKDRSPVWAHTSPDGVTADEVTAMLAPLGNDDINLEELP